MKTQFTLLTFFFLLGQFTFAKNSLDSNTVNNWNDKALNIVYSDPQEAMKIANKSLELSRKIGFKRGEVRALIRKGIIYDVLTQYESAVKMYEQSLALSYKTNDKRGIASNINNLGLINYNTNHYYTSLKYFHRAFSIFTKEDDHLNLASASNNIGLVHVALNQEKQALYWFKRSLQYYKKVSEKVAVNDVYTNMANAFSALNNKAYSKDSALHYAQLALDGYLKNDNKYGAGIIYNNIGSLYLSKKDLKTAEYNFKQAAKIGEEIGSNHSYVHASINLAMCYEKQNRSNLGFQLFESLIPYMKDLHSNQLESELCAALSHHYYQQGKIALGEKYHWLYLKKLELLQKELMNKNVIEISDKYQIKEIKQQSEFQLKQSEESRFLANVFWASGLTFMILVVLLIVFIRRKSNLQKELEGQKEIFKATTEERKRISYDLHDHVGSQLSYVVNNLELLKHLDSNNDRLNNTFAMSQAAMSSLRDTVWTLHTEEITMDLLSQRMENVMRKTLEQTPNVEATMKLNIKTDEVVPPQVTMHVMRIFQESIHNVVKHAKASTLSVQLSKDENDRYNLSIADNGVGFNKDRVNPFHYGLQSMRERARKIEGTFEIQSEINQGTLVTINWKNTPFA